MQTVNLLVICFFIAAASSYIILSILKYNQVKISITFFIILFISNIVSTIFVPVEFRFIYGFLIHSLLTLLILKQNVIKSILIGFIIMFMVTISEILISILFIFGLDLTIETIKTNEVVGLALNISIAILMGILISFKQVRNIIKRLIQWLEESKAKYYTIAIILVILYLLVAKNAVLTRSNNDFLLNLIFITFISILFVLVLNTKNEVYNLNKANKQMMKYLNRYENIITNQGKINHEFKNQLLVIKGYAETDINDLKKYLIEITNDISSNKSKYLISQLNNLPNGGLKGLIYYKISEIEEASLKYEIYVDKKVKTYFSKADEKFNIKLTKVLGVCLNNAIEAANKSIKKEIVIQIFVKNNKAIFMICNTFNDKNAVKRAKTNKQTNTKRRGFGLLVLKEIVNEQKSIKVSQENSKDTFTTEVEISKPF